MTKKLTKQQREVLTVVARIGGKAKFKKVGKEGMAEMGRKGGRPKKIKHE